jgi:hypothetical protein
MISDISKGLAKDKCNRLVVGEKLTKLVMLWLYERKKEQVDTAGI